MRKVILVLVVTLAAAAILAPLGLLHYANTPERHPDADAAIVAIPKAAGLRQIRGILSGAGVVTDDIRFELLAMALGLAKELKAGEYFIPSTYSPAQVIRLLASGRVYQRKVTILEGMTLNEIVHLLDSQSWGRTARFQAAARDRLLMNEMGIEAQSLEGYLFPDTYLLSRGEQDEAAILRQMVRRQQALFRKIERQTKRTLDAAHRHRVVTLASIVEKEASSMEEKSRVAGVFLNRLALGMRLQADPTVIYGLADFFDGRLSRADLAYVSPYNTYLVKGLPPGPICSPGEAAIRAVLYPERHDYLYFVVSGDGGHNFSSTLGEHNSAVANFRKLRKKNTAAGEK